jgi:hypothetical protein
MYRSTRTMRMHSLRRGIYYSRYAADSAKGSGGMDKRSSLGLTLVLVLQCVVTGMHKDATLVARLVRTLAIFVLNKRQDAYQLFQSAWW